MPEEHIDFCSGEQCICLTNYKFCLCSCPTLLHLEMEEAQYQATLEVISKHKKLQK